MKPLEFVGLTDVAHRTVRTLGVKERRFIEVARAVVGQPKLILLDEPAAGLPDAETELLGDIIRSIPDRVGATVILVDHDMSLVQACCDWTAVLDFGRLLASGPTAEVLRDPNVMKAYLGTEEVAREHAVDRQRVGRPWTAQRCPRRHDRSATRRGHHASRAQRCRQVEPGAWRVPAWPG